MPTPHIAALPGQIAKTVLMPGDPHRSRLIAETYLQNATLINDVRGVQGYTGTYEGRTYTVMASGMGMPSMGIYSYELFHFYDVETLIRVGTIGSYLEHIPVRSLIIGRRAYSHTNYLRFYEKNGGPDYVEASPALVQTAEGKAKEFGFQAFVGDIYSSDTFYDDIDHTDEWRKLGLLGVEMEAAALYMNAARTEKKALTICVVSDNLVTGEELSSEERQRSFGQMVRLALAITQ